MSARWRRRCAAIVVVLVVIVVVAVVGTAVVAVRVDGVSMEPTLRSNDRIVVVPTRGTPHRFDVVVARFSPTGPESVKRVIAVPGDRVSIARRGNTGVAVRVRPAGSTQRWTVVNPAWQDRTPKATQPCCTATGTASGDESERTVPPGQLFLLGDNLAQSDDSRRAGWVPESLVQGTVRWRVYPLGAVGSIDAGVTMTAAS